MIEIKLESYEEKEILDKIVNKTIQHIFHQSCYFGEIPKEGHYSTFDRFKNQVAQLVADKIYNKLVSDEEVKNRINIACDKAEKSIYDSAMKIIANNVKE